ncbi:MFS transporter [Serinibacter arcticus]|uniref:MFS transporter n=1 Tax=Serinibacter arcticus TaxID=1655435 RepID=A0A2U1ZV89_9MICO|nr:MFS transporter [Serinibacter arcticus]PWD50884.1 MFS transporter [Serinibacter arcticus]
MTVTPSAATPGRSAAIGGVLAMLALALALRAPIVAVPPVVTDLRDDLGVSASAVALLTSIPVLLFGLVTPVSSTLLRVLGLRTSGLLCLGGVVVGSVLRSGGSFALAIVGTLLIGAAISIGNLVVPVLIGRHYPMRTSSLMGAYTSTMNVGATAATATTAALAATHGWQLVTGAWGVLLGGIGLALWLAFAPREPRIATATGAPPPTSAVAPMWRNGTAWLLAATFACQSISFYTITTWLPTAMHESLGMDQAAAGWGASGFHIAGILGPLLVPLFLALVKPSDAVLVAVVGAFWAALPVGMLIAPQLWGVWVLAGGLAQGGYFAVVFLLVVRHTRTSDENRRMAAHVQTVGYCCAATGPVVMGWVHENVPGWSSMFAIVSGIMAVMILTGVAAARRPRPTLTVTEEPR